MDRRRWIALGLLGSLGCSDDGVIGQSGSGSTTAGSGSTATSTTTATSTPTTALDTSIDGTTTHGSTGPAEGTTYDGPKLDVGTMTGDETGPLVLCEVPEGGMDAPGPCDYQAPADSFDPVLEWEWLGDGGVANSATTPLVANLTDDDGNGSIDPCDVPDVVVLAWQQPYNQGPGHLYVLDGASGSLHFEIDAPLDDINPALGDIDGDGLPEIVAQTYGGGAVAFEHDGTLEWQSAARTWPRFNAIALADLEGDGDVEILMPGGQVLDHEGNVVLASYLPSPDDFWEGSTPFAMDLDGDGDLEIIDGRRAFHHDGTPLWNQATNACPQPPSGADIMPALADLAGPAYHVTNVREDGTIPAVQPPSWQQLNTFRTQAQIATTGGTCEPAG